LIGLALAHYRITVAIGAGAFHAIPFVIGQTLAHCRITGATVPQQDRQRFN
jgi:hypothetical protein